MVASREADCATCRIVTRWERERKARLAAEEIAEQGLRELYEKKNLLQLLGTVAMAANEAVSIEEALLVALREVCAATGWEVGHIYLSSKETPNKLVATTSWSGASEPELATFRSATEELDFNSGVGLPGRVLSTGEPALIADLHLDLNFPRRAAAKRSGLLSGFAFPIKIGDEVVAVVEFFSKTRSVPDASFLTVMQQIGAQLGRVVERKRLEDRLVFDAFHDPLTGLPNRKLLFERLTRALARHTQQPAFGFAVIFVDLDRFKTINDSLGHGRGDELLLLAARRLIDALARTHRTARSGDGAGAKAGTLARFGGDEFVVLLEDVGAAGARHVARRLLKTLVQPFEIDGRQLYITASVGIAQSGPLYTHAGEVLRDADLAMYRAKAGGRARYQVFNAEMHAEALRRLDLETALRSAHEKSEFRLYYQPIVELDSGALHGFEALIRWSRPGQGIVAPGAFIDVLEETMLVVKVGRWVLRQACHTGRRWQMEHPAHSGLVMSVNISANQFLHPSLADDVRSALAESGLSPKCLKLEITESCTMGDSERAIDVLKELRGLGVLLSVDDFGTGFSSLSYLHRFPLQNLKIDRSFVRRMLQDSESRAIVQSILKLGQQLGLDITAEGAESEAEVAHLRSLGCNYAQGYYFSRPLPEREAVERMLQWRRAEAPSTLQEA